jgi:hypothetical protein
VAAGANANTIITGDNVTYLHYRRPPRVGLLALALALMLGGTVAVRYWPDSAAEGSPLAVSVEHTPSAEHCDGWVFPGKMPSQLPLPAGEPTAEWAHRLGGIDNTTPLRLVIQGTYDHGVVLHDIRVIEQRRTKLAPGTTVALGWGCGGGLPVRQYQVELGSDRSKVELIEPQDDDSVKIVDKPFGYKVSAVDPEIFAIRAHTPYKQWKECDCLITWKLALDWSYKGKRGTLVIDDKGAPFRTGAVDSDQFPFVTKNGNSWK